MMVDESEIKSLFKQFETYYSVFGVIELQQNAISIQILQEIHAAFFHLGRFCLEDGDGTKECLRASDHLVRAILDAFKLKLKYYNIKLDNHLNCKYDLKLISDGEYLINLLKDDNEIVASAREAKKLDVKANKDEGFTSWKKVYNLISDFDGKYNFPSDIEEAKRKFYKEMKKTIILSVWPGAILATACYILIKIFILK